jgi:hypothetical protein
MVTPTPHIHLAPDRAQTCAHTPYLLRPAPTPQEFVAMDRGADTRGPPVHHPNHPTAEHPLLATPRTPFRWYNDVKTLQVGEGWWLCDGGLGKVGGPGGAPLPLFPAPPPPPHPRLF